MVAAPRKKYTLEQLTSKYYRKDRRTLRQDSGKATKVEMPGPGQEHYIPLFGFC